ncbi:MAG: DUF2511 domain-containing protein [Planctomycetales bacterium]|nr:DUF2511 domain-containing protein [Planctomycetales bacterium]
MRTGLLASMLLAFSSAPLAASSEISRSDLGEDWPLSVPAGTLRCDPLPGSSTSKLVTFQAGSKVYALNGIARGHAKSKGWHEIDAIWSEDPEVPGLKLNIQPLIQRGLALCS